MEGTRDSVRTSSGTLCGGVSSQACKPSIQGHMVNNLFRLCRPNCLCHQYLTPPTQPKTATATTNGRSKSRADALVTQTGRLGSGTLGWCLPTHPALRSSLTYSAPRAGGGGASEGMATQVTEPVTHLSPWQRGGRPATGLCKGTGQSWQFQIQLQNKWPLCSHPGSTT